MNSGGLRLCKYPPLSTKNTGLVYTNDYCLFLLYQSGLTAAVRASDTSLTKAEDIMLEFVKQHTPSKVCPLAGNSVHADKNFLDKYMPRFMDHLHYRIVDVSTLKELCRYGLDWPAKCKGTDKVHCGRDEERHEEILWKNLCGPEYLLS